MTPEIGRSPRPARAVLAALALILALPSTATAGSGFEEPTASMVVQNPALPPGTATFVPLINSGDVAFGDTFEGIPDGIGAVPRKDGWPSWLPYLGNRADFVDLYVAHEQSHVPFGGFADVQDSSVTRVRISTQTREVVDMQVVLPASAGFIRFCSAFMAGPREGFPFYTFLLNEESNDQLEVPPGAVYGADPSLTPNRQAGYAVYLNTVTGKYDVIAGAGRHNHENTVVVPGGWWGNVVSLSGDDSFATPSTPDRPNLSQIYQFSGRSFLAYTQDRGELWAFRVTGTHTGPLTPEQIVNPLNGANDYLDIAPGQTWKGEFIKVPEDIARGTTAALPQNALEDWSNANNVFQFVRVEDMDYDPDNPRVVYFTDTGNTRIKQSAVSGRLYRQVVNDATQKPWTDSDGRVFRMVLNAHNPRMVDSFSIVAEGGLRVQNLDGTTTTLVAPWFRSPDNLDAGSNSLMLQEDAADAKIWQWNYGPALTDWRHIATVDGPVQVTPDPSESSGILDVSRWFGAGWWALDVQAHARATSPPASDWQFFDPTVQTWTGPPGPAVGSTYQVKREQGQLLLMHVPGS